MASFILSSRDIISDAAGVKNTFSSWDACMSKNYCKWPVTAGIIIGSLIALSILTCLVRCLCCGAECCCACFSCCNRCCPSPRSRNKTRDYPPPMPAYSNPPFNQYQSHPAPVYGAGGYRSAGIPQTATFETPSRVYGRQDEDSLPAMPSWSEAKTSRVEEEVEMIKIEPLSTPGDRLITRVKEDKGDDISYENPEHTHSADVGIVASPYQDQHDTHDPYGHQANQGYGQAIGTAHSGTGYNTQRQVASPTSPQHRGQNPYDSYERSPSYGYQTVAPYGETYQPPRQNWSQPISPAYTNQRSQQQYNNASPGRYEQYAPSPGHVRMPDNDTLQEPTPHHLPYPENARQEQSPTYNNAFLPTTNSQNAPTSYVPYVSRKPVRNSWRDI